MGLVLPTSQNIKNAIGASSNSHSNLAAKKEVGRLKMQLARKILVQL
jgi:hypothetical protein